MPTPTIHPTIAAAESAVLALESAMWGIMTFQLPLARQEFRFPAQYNGRGTVRYWNSLYCVRAPREAVQRPPLQTTQIWHESTTNIREHCSSRCKSPLAVCQLCWPQQSGRWYSWLNFIYFDTCTVLSLLFIIQPSKAQIILNTISTRTIGFYIFRHIYGHQTNLHFITLHNFDVLKTLWILTRAAIVYAI